jgi:hypothetical protein
MSVPKFRLFRPLPENRQNTSWSIFSGAFKGTAIRQGNHLKASLNSTKKELNQTESRLSWPELIFFMPTKLLKLVD